jgi:hypothetical protein
MSLGEDRVRVKFNPSDDTIVSEIKQMSARLIDACHAMADRTDDPEIKRCLSLAMTHFEDAAMWAVKAATAPKD